MKITLLLLGIGFVLAVANAAEFSHELKGKAKPWTNEGFLDDPQEFHFAVIGDLNAVGTDPSGFSDR